MEHSDESIERAVLTLREMTQERRGRGISAVMMLEEQIIALRKDAERYRWLREHSTEYSLTQKDGYGGRELLGWDELDAAVDAAIAAVPAVGAA